MDLTGSAGMMLVAQVRSQARFVVAGVRLSLMSGISTGSLREPGGQNRRSTLADRRRRLRSERIAHYARRVPDCR
jgi:hypothetical protein